MEIKTHLGNFQCSCKKQTDSVILIYTQTGIRANYEMLKENHKPTTTGDWYLCCFTCCGKPFFSKDCAPSNPLLSTEHVGPFKCDCAHKRGILPLGDPHTMVTNIAFVKIYSFWKWIEIFRFLCQLPIVQRIILSKLNSDFNGIFLLDLLENLDIRYLYSIMEMVRFFFQSPN